MRNFLYGIFFSIVSFFLLLGAMGKNISSVILDLSLPWWMCIVVMVVLLLEVITGNNLLGSGKDNKG